MGIINSGIQSVAEERARAIGKIERIHAEVTESVADDAVFEASGETFMESVMDGGLSTEELEELLGELPDNADMEKEEIARILTCEDDDIDIDDIVGVTMNAE